MKPEYWIKRPKGKNHSFEIYERFNRKYSKKIKDARITAINKLYKEGTQDAQVCEAQLRTILAELSKIEKPIYTDANLDIFERYWTDFSKRSESMPHSLQSRRNAFKRALAALGNKDLTTASIDDFQAIVRAQSHSQSWVYAGCFITLLNYIGRPGMVIKGLKRIPTTPAHLTLTQFIQMVQYLPENWKILAWVAFGTGARFGELFALAPISDVIVRVGRQWAYKKDPVLKRYVLDSGALTKTRTTRDVGVLPEAVPWLIKWYELPLDVKETMRRTTRAPKILRAACQKAQVPEIVFHDLRHSYAIRLLVLGFQLSEVAQALGDLMSTVQRYYTGVGMSSEQVMRFADKLQSKK